MKTVSAIILFFSILTFSVAQSNCYNDFGFSVGYPTILSSYSDVNQASNSKGSISLSLFTNSQLSININHSIKFGLQVNYTKLKLEGPTDIFFTDANGNVIGNRVYNDISMLNIGMPLTYSYTKNSKVRYNIGFIPHLRFLNKYKLSNSSNDQETLIPTYTYNLRKVNLAAYIGVGFLQRLGPGIELEITPFAQMNILNDSYNSTFSSHRYCQIGVAFGFLRSKV